ncbi:hypothetical protein SAMN05414139_05594 [Burkholderia sp. D7]|nr:hypothetical protein SAMN05414139_05594 [Burkholderia sp. D7]
MAFVTNIPSKAVITTVGSASAGGTSGEALPVIMGTADAGTAVTVYDGVRWLGTTIVTSDGLWLFTPTVALKAGLHKFTAISINSEDQWGTSSTPISVTIDLPAVTPPVITDILGGNGLPIAPGSTTTESYPSTTGTGKPGDTVTLFDGQQAIGSAVVDYAGKWWITADAGLADGTHDLYAIASNVAGSYSSPSNHAAFTIDTMAPVPGVEGIDTHASDATLTLSVTDVLNLGERDLFHHDKPPAKLGGKTGDPVDLPESRVAGLVEGEWLQHGTSKAGGAVYIMAEHSGALVEPLAQQGVDLATHQG